jgi:hypothetical protein
MNDPLYPRVNDLKKRYPRLFLAYRDVPGPSVGYPRGWTSFINELFDAIDKLLSDTQAKSFRIEQIKEKYGGLRFYYSIAGKLATFNLDIQIPGAGRARLKNTTPASDAFPIAALDKLIADAEKRSEVTCFFCGVAGSERDDGWIYVACDACAAQRRNPTQPDPKP